jgi:uncharacterized protein YjgD (DUF1641 family)
MTTEAQPPPTSDHDSGDSTERILARLEAIESKVDRLSSLRRLEAAATQAQEVPHLAAMTGDIFDAWMKKRIEEGLDPQAALDGLGALAKVLARPEVLRALTSLSERLPEVARLAEDAPKLVAAAMDAFDELAARAAKQGLEPDEVLKSFLTVGVRVTEVLDSPQFKALLASDVLAPSTLDVVGRAGRALTEQSSEACGTTGIVGTLSAVRDEDIQRALYFAVGFARRFGRKMSCGPEGDQPQIPSRSSENG